MEDEARELVHEHGSKAIQAVVSRIVVAVQSGQESPIRDLGMLLKAVEELLDEQVAIRRYGRAG